MNQISEFVYIRDILDDIMVPNKILPNPYCDFPFLVIENFLDNDTCDEFMDFTQTTKNQTTANLRNSDGTFGANENTRKTKIFDLPQNLIEKYQNAFENNRQQIEGFFAKAIISSTQIQALGYFEGDFYKAHSDDSSFLVDKEKNLVGFKLVAPNRKITTVVFANDDFEGGELEFNFLQLENGDSVIFKPKKGSMIAFASNSIFTHEVKKVLKGFRLSFAQWHNAL